MKYKLGMRLIDRDTHEEYILASVEKNKICMICLNDGMRFLDPVKVNDIRMITKADMKNLCGNMVSQHLDSFMKKPKDWDG